MLFYTALTGFLLTIVSKIVQAHRRKCMFNKNFKRKLRMSKLFFKGVFPNVRTEIKAIEGIKYTKTQLFLQNIVKQTENNILKQINKAKSNNKSLFMNYNKVNSTNNKNKVSQGPINNSNENKSDKKFISLLNSYMLQG